MIRSVEHKYLFVQLPRTGCTAVARELVDNYGGERILSKHSRYHEFVASSHYDESYTVFSTVRHPLDDLVSSYEKLRTNHENYLDPARHDSQPNGYISDDTIERYKFVSGGGSFDAFVRKYSRLPFDNWASLAHASFDHVMRFESLATDLAAVLEALGLDVVRPLPSRNSTERSSRSWETYYDDPSLQAYITPRVLPFMRRFNFEFPENWRQGGQLQRLGGEAAFRVLQPRRKRWWLLPAPGFEDGK